MEPRAYFDRYAASTWVLAKLPLDEALRRIADAGFRWVEIGANGFHLDPRLKPDLAKIRRTLAELGVGVHSVHTPFHGLDIADTTRGDPKEWRRVLGDSIRLAGELGASLAVVHPSSHREALSAGTEAASREAARKLIAELADIAEASGTRIALENMTNLGYWRYGTSLVKLAAEFPDPRIGFCLDTGHVLLNGQSFAEEIAAAGERLLSIHAADNNGQRDLHFVPADGVIDWSAFLDALARAGYTRRLVVEANGRDEGDAVLARMASAWERLPDRVGASAGR